MAATLDLVVPVGYTLPAEGGLPRRKSSKSKEAKLGDMRNGREEEAGRGKGMWGVDVGSDVIDGMLKQQVDGKGEGV